MSTEQDDYDPALVVVGHVYDLALTKVIDATATPGPYAPGDDVTFTIQVCNQGTLDAQDIALTDYLPTDMSVSVNETNWTDNLDGTLTLTNNLFPSSGTEVLPPFINNCEDVSLTLTIDEDFQGTSITNWAEISGDNALDYAGEEYGITGDIDSTPDDTFEDDA